MRVPLPRVNTSVLGAKQLLVRTSVGVVLPAPLVHLHVDQARQSGVNGQDFHFRPARGSIGQDEVRYRIAFGNMHGAGLCGLPQHQVDRVRVPIAFHQAAQHFELRHSIDQRQEQRVDTFVGPADIRKVQFEQLNLIGAIEEAEPGAIGTGAPRCRLWIAVKANAFPLKQQAGSSTT